MFEIIKPGLILCLICLVASACLGVVSEITKEPIAHMQQEEEKKAQQKLFPSAESFSEVAEVKNENIEKVFTANNKTETLGYIFNVSIKGFSGPIQMAIAIDEKGTVKGLEILRNTETPGLGSKIKEDKFRTSYDEKTGPFTVVKSAPKSETEIEAITSATISSNAVTDGINIALDAFSKINK